MATLEKIRRRAGILVMGAIGLAMLGFILGDFNVRPSTKVAEINGKSYGYEEYQNEQNTLMNFYRMNYGQNLDPQLEQQIEDETWRRMVRNSVMGKSYEKLGLNVSTDELKSMVSGDQVGTGTFNEPHPIVRQMFSNPETGEFNRYVMMNYFNSLDREEYAQEKERWLFIENEIIDERMSEKYFNLLGKGLRPSSLDVRNQYLESQKKVDFSFVSQNFSSVSDEEIEITEAELKAYYKENIENYKSTASRSIEYVTFEVVASDMDDANSKLWATQTKNEFQRTEKDRLVMYVNSISDEPFNPTYLTLSEVSSVLKDSLLGRPEGEVFGPYFENESYKLSRLSNADTRPDSVRARHILIGYNVVGTVQAAEDLADSLYTVIENGGDFNNLAMQFSADESNRAIGGDLGWFREGQMQTAFNDVCFENNTGDLLTTETSFGVHIVKIEAQSRPVEKVQIATIVHNVIASNETDQEFYNRAVKFRGKATTAEKFEEQAREYGFDPRLVPNIAREQRQIPGLSQASQIIGWAFNAEAGEVSSIFQVDDDYIVAALTEVQEDGHAEFENVRAEVELAVRKQKKGELLQAKMSEGLASGGDLDAFAGSQELEVSEANQVQFANTFVSGIGIEPFIVGAAMYLPEEQVSGPFIGDNGVVVLSITNRDAGDTEGDMNLVETQMNYNIASRSSFEAYNAMMEDADIEDNRLKLFYGRN